MKGIWYCRNCGNLNPKLVRGRCLSRSDICLKCGKMVGSALTRGYVTKKHLAGVRNDYSKKNVIKNENNI